MRTDRYLIENPSGFQQRTAILQQIYEKKLTLFWSSDRLGENKLACYLNIYIRFIDRSKEGFLWR